MAEARKDLRLGFLTAIEAEGAFIGGLLITNQHGRPLEFQCTAPVRPNRMQEILYGPTLKPFVLGELIGQTLLEKAAIKPHLVLTDEASLLELRRHIPLPVACLSGQGPAKEPAGAEPPEPAESAEPRTVSLGRQMLHFHPTHPADGELAESCSTLLPRDADLSEPFERVREALTEAMGAAALR